MARTPLRDPTPESKEKPLGLHDPNPLPRRRLSIDPPEETEETASFRNPRRRIRVFYERMPSQSTKKTTQNEEKRGGGGGGGGGGDEFVGP